ncbi:ABC transporter ATP-binding protein, partial [Streptomyces sp. SID5926]|nr:ABC transporter ATP-binding protein [Streptomyces sp. SID5926]
MSQGAGAPGSGPGRRRLPAHDVRRFSPVRKSRPVPPRAPGRALEALVLLCSAAAAVAAVAQPLALGRTLDLLLRDGDAGWWLPLSAGLLLGELLLDSATSLFTGRCNATWTASVRAHA